MRRIFGWRDALARWILSILAGRRIAFRNSEESKNTINDFGPVLGRGGGGCGTVIVLDHGVLKDPEFKITTFSPNGIEITVTGVEEGGEG